MPTQIIRERASSSVKKLGSPVMYLLKTCHSTLTTIRPMITTRAHPRARSTFFLSPISLCVFYGPDQAFHHGVVVVSVVYSLHGGPEGRLLRAGDLHPGPLDLLQGPLLGDRPELPLSGHRALGGLLQPAPLPLGEPLPQV